MEEWIPLIIFGIAAVVSLFKEIKKKQTASSPKPVAKPAGNAPLPTPKPAVKKASAKPSRPAAKPAVAPFLTIDMEQDHNAIPDEAPILVEPEDDPTAPTLDAQSADEIRRAVIYSEILNRKY